MGKMFSLEMADEIERMMGSNLILSLVLEAQHFGKLNYIYEARIRIEQWFSKQCSCYDLDWLFQKENKEPKRYL